MNDVALVPQSVAAPAIRNLIRLRPFTPIIRCQAALRSSEAGMSFVNIAMGAYWA